MFTGIVQLTGIITERSADNRRMRIRTGASFMQGVRTGDSICCNGVCLTAVDIEHDSFAADLSGETLRLTSASDWKDGQRLNLEPAMAADGRFGGHIVTGHADGTCILQKETDTGNGIERIYSIPPGLEPLIAPKGSVCIDGVSLTVNKADMRSFSVMLIPHTLQVTILGEHRPGTRANIEADIAARYLLRMRECDAAHAAADTALTPEYEG